MYDDEANRKSDPSDTGKALHHRRNEKGSETSKRNTSLMAKILQYLECPQYLRSYFFPLHDDLKSVGLLNPLDAPHHLRSHEKCLYREGVVVPATADKDKERAGRNAKGTKQCPVLSLVNVGLKKNAIVHAILEPQLRVTVKFRRVHEDESEALHGDPVPPHTPRVASGLYWGYDVRVADTFSAVFSQSPHDDGYDLSIGISPNGMILKDIFVSSVLWAVLRDRKTGQHSCLSTHSHTHGRAFRFCMNGSRPDSKELLSSSLSSVVLYPMP